MAYEPFQRNYYRGGGGAGFGGNAFVSLLGGAAQGLLSAQKNRAELIKQAQEEALRRAAEQRAIDSSAREQERLNMARKQQEEASKERMKAEEERQRLLRKQREEEARIRADSEKLFGEYQANPEMAGYYTETEMKAIARRVAAGEINPPRPPKPSEPAGLHYEAPDATSKAIAGAGYVDQWLRDSLGRDVSTEFIAGANPEGADIVPNEVNRGIIRLPPQPGKHVTDAQGNLIQDPHVAIQTKLIPDLVAATTHWRARLATLKQGSPEWLDAKAKLDMVEGALADAQRRVAKGSSGDFADQTFDYSGVSTSPGRQ